MRGSGEPGGFPGQGRPQDGVKAAVMGLKLGEPRVQGAVDFPGAVEEVAVGYVDRGGPVGGGWSLAIAPPGRRNGVARGSRRARWVRVVDVTVGGAFYAMGMSQIFHASLSKFGPSADVIIVRRWLGFITLRGTYLTNSGLARCPYGKVEQGFLPSAQGGPRRRGVRWTELTEFTELGKTTDEEIKSGDFLNKRKQRERRGKNGLGWLGVVGVYLRFIDL